MSLQEEAKKLLPLVQALADGREVQYKNLSHRYNPIGSLLDLFVYRSGGYHSIVDESVRIKPEKKWRPYTRDEWERVVRVRCKEHGHSYPVQRIETDVLFIYGTSYTFAGAMKYFTNLDGTPCGVEVEDA